MRHGFWRGYRKPSKQYESCLAFILFAIDRKNLPAILFATAFAVCHLVFAVVNFIVK